MEKSKGAAENKKKLAAQERNDVGIHPNSMLESGSSSTSFKWMAFDTQAAEESSNTAAASSGDTDGVVDSRIITEKASIVARTAEWGVVVKPDDSGEGVFKVIGRSSDDGN